MAQLATEGLVPSADYQFLLESGSFSDVTVVVGGASGVKEFPLHKAVLSAHSPVFRAMFTTDNKETQENRVTIDDITVEVFESLIDHIYSGAMPNLGDFVSHAMQLFVAADKYQLESLKKQCSIFIASELTIETVVEILSFADMHSDAELKSKSFTFIGEHLKEVQATTGWQRFKDTKQVDLMEELMNSLMESKRDEEQVKRKASKVNSLNRLSNKMALEGKSFLKDLIRAHDVFDNHYDNYYQ